MIQLNYRDSKPIYEQIKDGFRKLIISDSLYANEKLPSVRELASSLAINPNTIQRAYHDLEQEGYIYTVAGKGSFVAGRGESSGVREHELLEEFDEIVEELYFLSVKKTELMERIDNMPERVHRASEEPGNHAAGEQGSHADGGQGHCSDGQQGCRPAQASLGKKSGQQATREQGHERLEARELEREEPGTGEGEREEPGIRVEEAEGPESCMPWNRRQKQRHGKPGTGEGDAEEPESCMPWNRRQEQGHERLEARELEREEPGNGEGEREEPGIRVGDAEGPGSRRPWSQRRERMNEEWDSNGPWSRRREGGDGE